jgi:site-specific DNA-methyltransferase (adenine-specific)
MSFYRWNTVLAELGFVFKEEIVWDKRYTTAPCIALSRVHETISLHTKKTGTIRRAKVPYVEQKQFDLESMVNDIKQIKSAINTKTGLNKIIEFLHGGELYKFEATERHCVSQQPGIKKPDRATAAINSIQNGMKEKSIIYSDVNNGRTGTVVRKDFPAKDRALGLRLEKTYRKKAGNSGHYG